MTTRMHTRLSAVATVDTAAVNPDCLKAAFEHTIETLVKRAEFNATALDWNTLEMALMARGADTDVVLRVAVVR
jgi:hypothetical protein